MADVRQHAEFVRPLNSFTPRKGIDLMPRIDAKKLEEFAVALLHAGGATQEEASLVGRSLVDANLCGYDSHGVMRIPYYVNNVAKGETVSEAPFDVLRESECHLAADANWGFGRVQAGRLLDALIAKAHDRGLGLGTLIHASHIGRLGEYCELAAAEQMVSMVMVNTHGATRRVAPPGGIAPRLGTNPLAMGSPHPEAPIVLDFSTSATAEGKVRVKRIAGELCPEGWLLDALGQPTTDPNALYGNPPGTILPMGGAQAYKGFGLALLVEIFAGALSGGLCARETPETPNGNCVFMLVADPEHFGGCDHFTTEVGRLAEFIRNCPRAPGVERILLPGDPERFQREQRLASGVPLDDENLAALLELAQTLTLPPPQFSS
jgi:hydroxycarboxylate dehydrogenase B